MNQDNVPLLAYIFVGMTSIVLAYVTLSDKEGIIETIPNAHVEMSPSETTEISAINIGLEPERPEESPSAPDQALQTDQPLPSSPDQALEIPTVEAEPLQSAPDQPVQAQETPQPQQPTKVEKRGGNKTKKTKSNRKKSKSKSKKTKSNRKKSN